MKPWKTGTDKAEFWCVYKGTHYRLACLSAHLKRKVPADKYLLIDSRYNYILAPKAEVAISTRID